ncbi:helix-turn-helix domain-containing protein [Patescibacteria group bacterium]|nr:helix-turn-helix domain-containing protein [Patescibacteria group bacterium]MBU4347312.1 helix-turn-helix domain-containing protein [Patescibacteria group bacterium]MBU4455285.1 helix-turn-helix domain-containing protein [Patescibacteria group bacterium]MCG2690517.1 helix-turn-helix domain-containing protein [Candidatus Parcubacteria bacterium]
MTPFKSNKISLNNENISEQLRAARKAKNLKLADIAKKLNISRKYLEALEKDEYDKLPPGVYGKNFLREYAVFLGLDYGELAKIFTAENQIKQHGGRQELFSKQVVKGRNFMAAPKIIKSAVIIAAASVCFIYLGYRLEKIVSPPDLSIYNPMENLITEKNSLQVVGKTEKEAQIIINGELVLSNTAGDFNKTINLKNGINIITITASNKYGRDNTIVKQVLVK